MEVLLWTERPKSVCMRRVDIKSAVQSAQVLASIFKADGRYMGTFLDMYRRRYNALSRSSV